METTIGKISVSSGYRSGDIMVAALTLHEDGEITAYDVERNSVSSLVWHHRASQWHLPDYVRKEKLENWLDRDYVRETMERIHCGRSVRWDGSNHVGTLTEDAQEAQEEIREMIDSTDHDDICYEYAYEAGEWIRDADDETWARWGGPVTATTTDEQLADIAQAITDEVDDDTYIDGDIEDHLTYMRDEARQEVSA